MHTFSISDFIESVFDLGAFIDGQKAFYSDEKKIAVKSLLGEHDISSLLQALLDDSLPAWIISPRTYDSLKWWAHFSVPTRKLRKVQLRRITKRRAQYRKHCARVNAATLEHVRAGGISS